MKIAKDALRPSRESFIHAGTNHESKKKDISDQEEGEEQLSILIKEAGEDARNRRKRTLDKHFEKLNQTIKKAASQIRQTAPR